MPANIEALWAADGWRVLRAQGHDFSSLYRAMREARSSKEPTVILCETVMGKGVSFMEGIPDYHGKALSGDRLSQALSELGSSMDEFNRMMAMRSGPLPVGHHPEVPAPTWIWGSPSPTTPPPSRTTVPPSARPWRTWGPGTTGCPAGPPYWPSTAT